MTPCHPNPALLSAFAYVLVGFPLHGFRVHSRDPRSKNPRSVSSVSSVLNESEIPLCLGLLPPHRFPLKWHPLPFSFPCAINISTRARTNRRSALSRHASLTSRRNFLNSALAVGSPPNGYKQTSSPPSFFPIKHTSRILHRMQNSIASIAVRNPLASPRDSAHCDPLFRNSPRPMFCTTTFIIVIIILILIPHSPPYRSGTDTANHAFVPV